MKAKRKILLFYIFLLEAKLKKEKRKDSGTDCIYGVRNLFVDIPARKGDDFKIKYLKYTEMDGQKDF